MNKKKNLKFDLFTYLCFLYAWVNGEQSGVCWSTIGQIFDEGKKQQRSQDSALRNSRYNTGL